MSLEKIRELFLNDKVFLYSESVDLGGHIYHEQMIKRNKMYLYMYLPPITITAINQQWTHNGLAVEYSVCSFSVLNHDLHVFEWFSILFFFFVSVIVDSFSS